MSVARMPIQGVNGGVAVSVERIESFFVGTYRHTIDDKGRTSIPAKFRQILEAADDSRRTYLVPLKDRIGVYPLALLARISESFGDSEFLAESSITRMRRVASKFEVVKFDKQGRVLIPEAFRAAVDLKDEIIFIGCFKMFEIWSYQLWLNQEKEEGNNG